MKILQDKIFISTRPEGTSTALKELLQQQGATLLEMPMIEIQPIELSEEDKNRLATPFDWIIFTSANGINYFFQQLKAINGGKLDGATKIGVIGAHSAKELEKHGYSANFINSGNTSNDFGKALKNVVGNNHPHILVAVGNLAGNNIENELKDSAKVERIDVYKTVMPNVLNSDSLNKIKANLYEMVIFTSPSSFTNFCKVVEGQINLQSLRAVCIGTTTANELTTNNIEPMVVATTMNSEGIVEAILEYYKEEKGK